MTDKEKEEEALRRIGEILHEIRRRNAFFLGFMLGAGLMGLLAITNLIAAKFR